MEKIKCIIIEDEPLAMLLLINYINQSPQLQLCHTFSSAENAALYLQKERVDLILLDLHLPGISGFDLLRSLQDAPAVIVTSGHPLYALEGFELNVTDFLLKPFSLNRFHRALAKLNTSNFSGDVVPSLPAGLYLPIERRKVRIDLDKILYIESRREYVEVITTDGKFISRTSTSTVEEMLPAGRFRRINRSFIVALGKIDSFTKRSVLVTGKMISIGKGYSLPVVR